MKPKTTIFLLIVLLGCFGYVFIVHTDLTKTQPAPHKQAIGENLFPSIPTFYDAVKLSITPAGQGEMTFEFVDRKWMILQPIEAAAEGFKIEDAVRPFERSKVLRAFSAGEDDYLPDATTGLDKPRWILKMVDTSGKQYVLEVGGSVPLSRRGETYVRPAGDDATYVIAYSFDGDLSASAEDYRDKSIFHLSPDRVVALRVEGAQTYQLKRDQPGTDSWRITEPIETDVDQKKADTLVRYFTHFRSVKMIENPEADLSVYGLASPRLIIKLEITNQQPTTAPATQPASVDTTYELAFGNIVGDNIYTKLAGTDQIYLVQKSLVASIQPNLNDLRIKTVMDFHVSNVYKVSISAPSGDGSFAKTGRSWMMTSPHPGPANTAAVNTLLAAIKTVKAEDFKDNAPSLTPFGLDEPVATITMDIAGKAGLQTFLVGKKSPSGEMAFVKNAAANTVAVVKTAALEKILADITGYWDPTLLAISNDEKIVTLEITRPGVVYALALAGDGKWILGAPIGGDADHQNVKTLADLLPNLTADKVVSISEKVPPRFADSPDRVAVTITTATADPTAEPTTQPESQAPATSKRIYRLNVVKVDNEYFAWLDNPTRVMVSKLDGELFKALWAEFRQRTVMTFDPDSIVSIRRTGEEESFELDKPRDKWQYTADPYVEINPTKVHQFLKSISKIDTEAYVTHSSPDDATRKRLGLDEPWFTFELTAGNGHVYQLIVSMDGLDSLSNRYVLSSEVDGVFILPAELFTQLSKSLVDFKM